VARGENIFVECRVEEEEKIIFNVPLIYFEDDRSVWDVKMY